MNRNIELSGPHPDKQKTGKAKPKKNPEKLSHHLESQNSAFKKIIEKITAKTEL